MRAWEERGGGIKALKASSRRVQGGHLLGAKVVDLVQGLTKFHFGRVERCNDAAPARSESRSCACAYVCACVCVRGHVHTCVHLLVEKEPKRSHRRMWGEGRAGEWRKRLGWLREAKGYGARATVGEG